jgi:hypothetical protein
MTNSAIRARDTINSIIIFKIFMLNRFLYEMANQSNIDEMMFEI